MLRMISAPVRNVLRFPLVQLAIVIGLILWLQTAEDGSVLGQVYSAIDSGVELGVAWLSNAFHFKSFTRSWLSTGLWIAYVYLACLIMLFVLRVMGRSLVELAGRTNAFGLRRMIARERGIAAYRAWLPLERIRPDHIPQDEWERTFAWPPNNQPPYRPLAQRVLLATIFYVVLVLIALVAIQTFTPFPVMSWLGGLLR
jgi:hypothetical protein